MDVYEAKLAAAAHGDREKGLELLEFVRKEKLRVPDVVVKVGQALVARGGLGDALWTIHEQVLIAALDLGAMDVVDSTFLALKNKFPDSSRVLRLEGMIFEAQGKYAQADALYKDILAKNPANMLVMKRQVSLLRAQGRTEDAITKLNALLRCFQTDAGAWCELSELYLSLGNYKHAAFCYEELILLNPLDALNHTRLAELYVTIGGLDNLRTARKHFAHALDLNAQSTRGLVGLVMCTSAIASTKTARPEKDDRELNARLHQFALQKLRGVYAELPTAAAVNAALTSTTAAFDE
ncbi:hypothetical protein SPRG_06736 [Saprolegnia parasitica CBS 223.65]|uniref:ER membrane protein complex subunit 2 n=1 Tax=Saprolegnia parasitica (strain CBS 223.65) TaxID=695850 RepID=A0A067CNU6_SAPPC|nr:hypothetical protein SPRG_06736 [Saprolegnia parasitica CBS 223.65]KDO28497.1 hypothetical protein SPRG_06736 [Saprolegnia parasitica CBS 223.65]|eukprot:XP_012200933.1 hypothetical protein SPRG_06736 [Saprolegnia parasitica CBS 223.65]